MFPDSSHEAGTLTRDVAGKGATGLTGVAGALFGFIWLPASSALLRVTSAKNPCSIPVLSR
jgi:hypothetical protein